MFDPSAFDLPAYLARIGHPGAVAPDIETLRSIALSHPLAIPFENLDPFLRRPVALDAASLQRKIVQGRRGGYCFEHNILLGTALTAIGFDVVGLAARVMWNNPPGAAMPRSHMLLLLHLDAQPWIVDAGFGGLTLTGPLRLEAGTVQETPHERFRLVRAGEAFAVQASVRDEWRALYRFDLQPQTLADYEVTSWYLSNNPRSHFLTSLIAARPGSGRRYALRNTELATHHSGGLTERRLLGTPAELGDVLADVFGIDVPDGAFPDDAYTHLRSTAAAT